jgi:hypothetical protein
MFFSPFWFSVPPSSCLALSDSRLLFSFLSRPYPVLSSPCPILTLSYPRSRPVLFSPCRILALSYPRPVLSSACPILAMSYPRPFPSAPFPILDLSRRLPVWSVCLRASGLLRKGTKPSRPLDCSCPRPPPPTSYFLV